MSSQKVIVQPHEELVLRVSVDDFFYPYPATLLPGETEKSESYLERQKAYQKSIKMRDLFLQAFQDISSLNPNDPWSFYQIAGIHGLPYSPYDNVGSHQEGNWGGYCTHGSILFPIWHRPYVLLLEQSLVLAALRVIKAANLNGEEDVKLAKFLRIPYFDWAAPRAAQFGVPSIFTDEEVTVNYPTKKTFVNPLRSFLSPKDVVPTKWNTSDIENSPIGVTLGKPYQPKDEAPFLPTNYPTVRYPNDKYQSQFHLLQMQFARSVQWLLRPGVFGFLKVNDWSTFSSHYYNPTGAKTYGSYTSIEVVHDMVHDRLGGVGGQMSYPDEAGFDPIFFFHHANVDRLTAIWQYCYPDSWMVPTQDTSGTFTIPAGATESEDTPLTPFRKSADNGKDIFWTSKESRYVETFKYSYPEVYNAQKLNLSSTEFLKQMLAYYVPTSHESFRWYLNVKDIPKNLFPGPYRVMAFLQTSKEEALTLPTSDPRYAGDIYVFSRGKETVCAKCNEKDNAAKAQGKEEGTTIFGCIDITQTMTNLHLDIDPEATGSTIPTEQPIVVYDESNPASFSVTLVYSDSKLRQPCNLKFDIRQEFHEYDDVLSVSAPAKVRAIKSALSNAITAAVVTEPKERKHHIIARNLNSKLFTV